MKVNISVDGIDKLKRLLDEQKILAEEMHDIVERIHAQELEIMFSISNQKAESEEEKPPRV